MSVEHHADSLAFDELVDKIERQLLNAPIHTTDESEVHRWVDQLEFTFDLMNEILEEEEDSTQEMQMTFDDLLAEYGDFISRIEDESERLNSSEWDSNALDIEMEALDGYSGDVLHSLKQHREHLVRARDNAHSMERTVKATSDALEGFRDDYRCWGTALALIVLFIIVTCVKFL